MSNVILGPNGRSLVETVSSPAGPASPTPVPPILEALAARRFKVRLFSQSSKDYTIFAADPKDAVDKVLQGFGTEAGFEPTTVVHANVMEMK